MRTDENAASPNERPKEPAGSPSPEGTVTSPAPAASAGRTDSELQPDARKLTPEEQMALFEKDLKENDWGHQPC